MKDCNQCGRCCSRYGGGDLSASAADIERWAEHRPDIHRYVDNGQIWVDPETGKVLERCPWLTKIPNQEKYACSIYEQRPEDCRYYPVRIEDMYHDGCEMLEKKDLNDLRRAQRRLDELMADSRPPMAER